MSERVTNISSFSGLNQYGDGYNLNPKNAVDLYNVRIDGGYLRPCVAPITKGGTCVAKIETLAAIPRRTPLDVGGGVYSSLMLVAAAGGQLYYMEHNVGTWTLLAIPGGYAFASYGTNVWSWCNYEIQDGADTIDVLIMSNTNAMIYIRSDDYSVTLVSPPYSLYPIARSNERLWGMSGWEILCYSRPYDFTDWTAATIPEDGGGEIMIPSWDGDITSSLTPMGSQLIAMKGESIWRIYGTDPGQYTINEQYGLGTRYPNTVSKYGDNLFFWTDRGLVRYDGITSSPFQQEMISEILAGANTDYFYECTGIVWRDKYYLSFPYGDSTTNNRLLIYDFKENAWTLRTDLTIESFVSLDKVTLTSMRNLFFTESETPGQVYEWVDDESDTAVSAYWESPWIDYGQKNANITGVEVRTIIESTTGGSLTLTIETDKKTKSKVLSYTSGSYKVPFLIRGKRLKLKISSSSTNHWKIVGGIEIRADVEDEI